MKRYLFLSLLLSLTLSCHAKKTDLNLQWKDFESKEAGIKANFPCEPKKSFKSFQDEPRPIHVYDFSCEVEGMKFLISSKHYMTEFNDKTFDQIFESNESILKNMFGAVESFNEKKDFLTNGFNSKYYEVKPKAGGKVNELVVVSKVRSYDVMFGIVTESEGKLKESNIDYESISKRFIDSFQVLENQ